MRKCRYVRFVERPGRTFLVFCGRVSVLVATIRVRSWGATVDTISRNAEPANTSNAKQEFQINPMSAVPPTPTTRGVLALVALRLGAEAETGDVLAMETESDETLFWLVQGTRPTMPVPHGYSSPLALGIDLAFPSENCAIELRRFRPAMTARGECSTTLFEFDVTTGPFLVPCHLLRVGKLPHQFAHCAVGGAPRSRPGTKCHRLIKRLFSSAAEYLTED
jgi:hypothetical protein